MKLAKVVMAGLLLALWAQAAQAYVIEIAFEGVITQASYIPADWASDVVVGATFSGVYTYDSDTLNNSTDPVYGSYNHYTSPYGVVVNIGSLVFQTDPCNTDFEIFVANDAPRGFDIADGYGFLSRENLLPNTEENGGYGISWWLRDYSATAISDVSLPLTAPILDEWTSRNEFEIIGPWGATYGIGGRVDSVELIPEPVIFSLLVLGGSVLIRRRRCTYS